MALLSPEPATAHIVVRPDLIEAGETVDLHVELSELRPGPPPEALELEGAGLEVTSTELEGTAGTETRWLARVRAPHATGVLPIVLRALYADGRSVEVEQTLTVVPANEENAGFPWPVVIAAVLLAVTGAVAALLLARRRA